MVRLVRRNLSYHWQTSCIAEAGDQIIIIVVGRIAR
jgi:hypothetical protein